MLRRKTNKKTDFEASVVLGGAQPPVTPSPPSTTHPSAQLTEFDAHYQPRVFIDQEAWVKMTTWIEMCAYEVNGLGRVVRSGNDFYVIDVFLIEQNVTAGNAEMDREAVGRYMHSLYQADRGDELENVYFQWHSHVNFQAIFSPTDLELITAWAAGQFLISMVINKQGDNSTRLDIYDPVRMAYAIRPWVVVSRSTALIRQCQQDFDALVSTPERPASVLFEKAKALVGVGDDEPKGVGDSTYIRPESVALSTGDEEEVAETGGAVVAEPVEQPDAVEEDPTTIVETEAVS